MIVADTNVIAYLLIPGKRSQASERLLKADPEWVAPALWLNEFTNILCTYERNGLLSPSQSVGILENALALMGDASYQVPPERTLAMARRTGCSGYDSQFLALAEDLGVKLHTSDKALLKKCPELAVEPA